VASPQTCLRGFQVCARVAPWPVDQARYGWYEHGGFAWCSPIPTGVTPSTGLRPASIFVYVYPLPPDAITGTAAGIALPVSAAGSPIPPTAGYFQTVFYPGTTGVTQAKTSTVAPGQSLPGENFAVRTPDVVDFAVSPQAGQAGRASPPALNQARCSNRIEGRRAPPAPPIWRQLMDHASLRQHQSAMSGNVNPEVAAREELFFSS
jgi:hypothetical protein